MERAGGFTERAAAQYLNMAQVVSDGMKIVVPDGESLDGAERYGLDSEDYAGGEDRGRQYGKRKSESEFEHGHQGRADDLKGDRRSKGRRYHRLPGESWRVSED